MSKLSSKILDKIKKEKVTPKPRWYFVLMHTLLGTAVLSSIFFGGIAVAIVIRHFMLTDWEMARQFAGGSIRSFIMLVPYIWIIFIGITILLADLLFKHTKKGYKLQPWKLVAGSIAISLILGGLFYVTKADKPIEEGLRNNLPPYQQWQIRKSQIFIAPEKGVLAGTISKINSEDKWIVIDFKDRQWFVDISKAQKPMRLKFEIGMDVGMIGEAIEEDLFKAFRIAPWKKEMRPPIKPMETMRKINERNF